MFMSLHVDACRIPEIYAQFHATVDQADYERDLKWWSSNHGVDMHMAWPVFEVRIYPHFMSLITLTPFPV